MLLEIRNVSIAYNGPPVVKKANISLPSGAIGCLLGPSGCGKTTLLRAIGGFEPVLEGEILLQGKPVSQAGRSLAPEKRLVGMVFQDLALFPHLNIADNIAFGLRNHDRDQRRQRVRELLTLVGLEHSAKVFPHQLSGGQQQRVALARAMAPRPELLLLDEPFSSLDVELREKLAREVRQILKHDGLTALLVTHDQFEAFAMADEIGVMHGGRLLQWDSAYNLYHHPAHHFVADFIGQGVLLPGTVGGERTVITELGALHGTLPEGSLPGANMEVLIRPDQVRHDAKQPTTAVVVSKVFRGADFLYTLRLPSGATVLWLADSRHNHPIGHRIGIHVAVDDLVIFREDGGAEQEAVGLSGPKRKFGCLRTDFSSFEGS
jgi:iron(III) transport system ATP-binding protein